MGYALVTGSQIDDDDVEIGRVLTVREFVERLKRRPDIFGKNEKTLTGKLELICMISAIISGYLLSNYAPDLSSFIDPDFIDPNMNVAPSTTAPKVIDRPPSVVKKPSVVSLSKTTIRKTITGNGRPSGQAGGSPQKRVAKRGVFALMAKSQIKGEDASFGEITAKGGFAETIDIAIAGLGGLKKGSTSSSGRIGASTIGFSKGYGLTGNGDGSGGIDDIIGAYSEAEPVSLKIMDQKIHSIPLPRKEGSISIGGRSRSSIVTVVMQNLPALRYLYNRSLTAKPGLRGKITVRFAIDEFGTVLHCDVVESTISDADLENMVMKKVRSWRFDKIDKPGDITEIVYPFVFSAG